MRSKHEQHELCVTLGRCDVRLEISHSEFKILWEALAQFVENYPPADPDATEPDHNPVEFETAQTMLEEMDAIVASPLELGCHITPKRVLG